MLFWDIDRLTSLRMSGYRVSNIAHNSDTNIGNMQLKTKEIMI